MELKPKSSPPKPKPAARGSVLFVALSALSLLMSTAALLGALWTYREACQIREKAEQAAAAAQAAEKTAAAAQTTAASVTVQAGMVQSAAEAAKQSASMATIAAATVKATEDKIAAEAATAARQAAATAAREAATTAVRDLPKERDKQSDPLLVSLRSHVGKVSVQITDLQDKRIAVEQSMEKDCKPGACTTAESYYGALRGYFDRLESSQATIRALSEDAKKCNVPSCIEFESKFTELQQKISVEIAKIKKAGVKIRLYSGISDDRVAPKST